MIGWLCGLSLVFAISIAFLRTKIKLLEEEITNLKNFKIVIYDAASKRGTRYELIDNNIGNHTLYSRD